MSDPVICIECGATSYNEPGKTPIRCASCWEKLKSRAEKAETEANKYEQALTEIADQAGTRRNADWVRRRAIETLKGGAE